MSGRYRHRSCRDCIESTNAVQPCRGYKLFCRKRGDNVPEQAACTCGEFDAKWK